MTLFRGICAVVSLIAVVAFWVFFTLAVFLPSLYCAKGAFITLVIWLITSTIADPKSRGRKKVR
jgi:hypothetical protein